MRVRKLLVILLVLVTAACPKSPSTDTGLTGAASPRAAVDAFLNAARAGDLQAMSSVWGTEKGPVRESLSRDELEKRQLIMVCHFKADQHRIIAQDQADRNEQRLRVALTKGGITKETAFWAVQGPAERWYVVNADLMPVQDFCRSSSR